MEIWGHIFCKSILIGLFYTKRGNLIFGIICLLPVLMAISRAIGINLAISGLPLTSIRSKIALVPYILLMMLCRNCCPTTASMKKETRYLMTNSKSIWTDNTKANTVSMELSIPKWGRLLMTPWEHQHCW